MSACRPVGCALDKRVWRATLVLMHPPPPQELELPNASPGLLVELAQRMPELQGLTAPVHKSEDLHVLTQFTALKVRVGG